MNQRLVARPARVVGKDPRPKYLVAHPDDMVRFTCAGQSDKNHPHSKIIK